MEEPPFRPEFFARLDEEPDEAFYTMPRKVVHIDDEAIAAIQPYLSAQLPWLRDGDLFSPKFSGGPRPEPETLPLRSRDFH